MKPREYCCCAIPMMSAGIYATIFEQFLLALLVAILSLATPKLVGASIPGFAGTILAIICFVAAGTQLFGFAGVYKEKASLFRQYSLLNLFLTLAAFAVAATWIILSATKHDTAVSTCEANFFANGTDASTFSSFNEGETLCNIFTWVDVGIMGGLWVVLALMQLYVLLVISSYGTEQRVDHAKYKSLYSVNFDSGIPLSNRNDPWDANESIDGGNAVGRSGHVRQDSTASVSTILAEKQQQPREYGYSDQPATYPPPQPSQSRGVTSTDRKASYDDAYLSHPNNAYTQDPNPTPYPYDNFYGTGYDNGGVQRPGRSQEHPAMGSFKRKGSSRLQKSSPHMDQY